MCGIAGFLLRSEAAGKAELRAGAKAMADRLAHRGPDDCGEWAAPEAGLAFGHRRLAIVDLSSAGAQPMLSGCGRMAICYNGEVYNAAEMRADLEARGRRFRGHSDTEAIVEGFAEWGVAATLERMVGMFALAVWDRHERELTLVRDRLGVKPLYWRCDGRGLAFASELKALLAAPGFAPPAISRPGLAGYWRYGYAPTPYSLYEDVWKLAPGELLRWRRDEAEPRLERFWSLPAAVTAARAEPAISDPDEAAEMMAPLLERAVKDRLISDAPLGAFLSGGVDSSLVAALMRQVSDAPVRTYSIGFRDADYDEAPHARAVAEHLGCAHTEHYLDESDLLAVMPRLAEIQDEPFADSSQIPTLLLSELTRREVTVALSGDGGDEVFAGYNRYLWAGRAAAARRRLGRPGRALAAAALRRTPPVVWDGAVARRLTGGRGPRASLARRAQRLGAMMAAASDDDAYLGLIAHWRDVCPPDWTPPPPGYDRLGETPLALPEERMQFLDALGYLPDDILTKIDRASMAVSLEVRVPLLDHRVVEASWRLALSAKLRGGVGKLPLRRLLGRHVPDALMERPKMGFAAPIDAWLRGPLKDWAGDLIGSLGWLRDLGFEPAPVERAWRAHQAGRGNHGDALWTALMLAQWREAA